MDATTIAKLLPEVYRETRHPGSVLDALLGVMEAFTTPAEMTLSSLDTWFDPRRAPDDFLRMLATWTSLGPYVSDDDLKRGDGRRRSPINSGNLRELVAAGAALSRIRGTREALAAMLELATGFRGFRDR